MALKTQDNPFGLDPADDLPYSAPYPLQVPHWTENALLQGSNKEGTVFFYHHFRRVDPDPRAWNGDFCLALEDGRVLIAKNFGYHGSTTTMSDGCLSFECIEPGRVWRCRFKGIAYLTSQDELQQGFLTISAPEVPTEFDVVFEATMPLYKFGALEKALSTDDWGSGGHMEQCGRLRGYVKYFDTRTPIDGYGWRDHSIGPRDFDALQKTTLAPVTFPSGRAFNVIQIGDHALGYVVDTDGTIKAAEQIVETPTWSAEDRDFTDREITISMLVDGGKENIEGAVTALHYHWTWMHPSQFCAGIDYDLAERKRLLVAKEMLVKYTWNGESTYGLLEMSRRAGADQR